MRAAGVVDEARPPGALDPTANRPGFFLRWAALAIGAWLLGLAPLAASPLSSSRVGSADYVNMVDVCGRLGLRFSFSARGQSMNLRGNGHSAYLLPPGDGSHRLMILDGVRVSLGDQAVIRAGAIYISRTDFERRLLPLLRPDLASGLPARPKVIMIDAGHGGTDPGTQNPRYHLQEKIVTLDVAQRLRPLLAAQGWKVLMIRTRDTQLSENKIFDLEERARLAASLHADLYVSIHFDAGSPSTRGSMILCYNPAGQRSSEKWGLGQRSDSQGPMPGNRNDAWNFVLAHALYRKLPHAIGTDDLGERIQNVSVLRNATIPAVLVEPAYISNAGEAQRVLQPEFRQRIAEALAAGIKDYAALIDSLQPKAAPRH
jgi:N-acetylmuramoyl-L-alanine amidase